MQATKQAQLAVFNSSNRAESLSATRLSLAQSNLLSELPGFAFAVLTLVYIVSSFASLI
jgi:hypothetical protein